MIEIRLDMVKAVVRELRAHPEIEVKDLEDLIMDKFPTLTVAEFRAVAKVIDREPADLMVEATDG